MILPGKGSIDMNILITGNMGYVGPSVLRQLRHSYPYAKLIGFDTGFFAHCLTNADHLPERYTDVQYFMDIRRVSPELLRNIDTVVHLAAISNDPMGNSFETVTFDINFRATVEFAKQAKQAGVKRFIFASSCSMYGLADDTPRTEASDINPLTAYAKSKAHAEAGLKQLADQGFAITSLRFATACGMSERLRLDLVVNDFVACAIVSKNITILSDGTPWRPLIHVKDMARAIDWAIKRESSQDDFIAINVGSNRWNYQVKDLAMAVAEVIPNITISINKHAPQDNRSYRVDFGLFEKLAPEHQPQMDLLDAINELRDNLVAMKFNDIEFRSSRFMRLVEIKRLREKSLINENLVWANL